MVHFGLAPFLWKEPLGLEYISAALGASGHPVRIVDLRLIGQMAGILSRVQQLMDPRAYLAEYAFSKDWK
jgi:hypothetical protein